MTAPVPVAPAKFTTVEDVKSRYVEGTFPTDRDTWVQLRIVDVESMLIGLVPSLGTTPVNDIAPDRRLRVVALVADKVLELYRNPRGAASADQSMLGLSASEHYRATTTSQAIWFSQQELDSVRPTGIRRRPRIGTWMAAPWDVPI